MAQATEEKTWGEQVVEDAHKAQNDQESQINTNEEEIQSLTNHVKTSEKENYALKRQLYKLQIEIERLC